MHELGHTLNLRHGGPATTAYGLSSVVVEHMKEEAPPQFAGVLQPINQEGTSVYQLGRNIPIKLQLKDTANQFISNAQLTFAAERVATSISGTSQESETSTTFTAGHLFTNDSAAKHYKYNWKTTGLQPGTWLLRIYQDYTTPDQRLLQGPQPPTTTGETVRLSIKP